MQSSVIIFLGRHQPFMATPTLLKNMRIFTISHISILININMEDMLSQGISPSLVRRVSHLKIIGINYLDFFYLGL